MHKMLKAVFPAALLIAGVTATHAQTVLATYNYPIGVSGVAVDYLRDRAYVLLPNYNPDGSNAVQVIDTKSNTVLNTFSTGGLANAIGVDVVYGLVVVGGVVPSTTNPSGIESEVGLFNPKTGASKGVIAVTGTSGYGIVAMAVDPITHRVFVSNASDNTVVAVCENSHKVDAVFQLGGQVPAGLAVNFVTGKVYATLNDNQVAIIDQYAYWKNHKTPVAFVTYGSQTSDVAIDPVLDREFVTDGVFSTPTVGVLNESGATLASVPTGLFPQGIDVDFTNALVFVANEADGTITEFNGDSEAVVSTIPIAANSIVVNPANQTVYAVSSTSVTVFTEN